jgi:hypothetical protein
LSRGRTRWRLAFAGAGIAALLAPASFGDAVAKDPTCFGALVLRDNTHMTGTFSTTLGPYLLRAVDAVMGR